MTGHHPTTDLAGRPADLPPTSDPQALRIDDAQLIGPCHLASARSLQRPGFQREGLSRGTAG